MVIRSGRYGKFLACSTYPACKNTKALPTGVKCPLDSGDIVERTSKRGRPFWSCSNYPSCTFSLWSRPLPKACPKCSASFLVEQRNKDGEVFHACVNKDCDYKERQEDLKPQPRQED
jgi:DNA topoisomerase-1